MLVIITETAVLISLFAVGLQLRMPWTLKGWRVAAVLASVTHGAPGNGALANDGQVTAALANGAPAEGGLHHGAPTNGVLTGGALANGGPVTVALAHGVPAQGGPVAGAPAGAQ